MTTAPRFGPRLEPNGGVTFRLWAPAAKQVEVVLDKPVPMQASGHGWYECRVHDARVGSRYRFRIDGEIEVPDPASHFQPNDVQGPSEIIDHRYDWQCTDWKGRPWNEAVILELHVGTFTKVGTFRGVIDRLDHLVATGITAIELMPLADFAGRWNWGYDGVLLYAPDSVYGQPEDLKALIDAAHARGLMVLLDVVYNHFGPEGNYLSRYAPQFFTSRHKTPWGDAIDYRVPEVRAFAIENAVHWLDNYRFDGLRLDAVHAITEPGEPHILHDLSRAVGELAAATGRKIHLVLENDDNRAWLLDPAAEVPSGKYRAQWNDDYHHAWHVLLTGETGGYYGDYAKRPMDAVARAVGQGFVYEGQVSQHRGGARRGEPSATLPPAAFVNFLQNHDQIGNRAYGDRLTLLAPSEAIEAALAVTLLAPSPPLLFMGEEWGTTQPFPFFCDFKGDLAEAVRKGRRSEFEAAFANVEDVETIPDPLAETTFRSAVLDWSAREREPHVSRLALVRSLLAARRDHIVPLIGAIVPGSGEARVAAGVLQASWRLDDGSALNLLANLTAKEALARLQPKVTTTIWGGEVRDQLRPWSVHWWLGAP
jgi:maltooligosyltrehalose trehalohydrolase